MEEINPSVLDEFQVQEKGGWQRLIFINKETIN